MTTSGEHRVVGRYGAGAPRQRHRRFVGSLASVLLALLQTGCPSHLPPPERLAFDTDPRILRGSYQGLVDTREVPDLMTMSGDGSLAAVSWPGSVEFWNLDTLTLVTTIGIPSGDLDVLSGLAVDRAGSIVAGVVNGKVRLWNSANGSLVSKFDPGDRLGGCRYCGVSEAALSPLGDLLAVSGSEPLLLVVDIGQSATRMNGGAT